MSVRIDGRVQTFNGVKVFSASTPGMRAELGNAMTQWLAERRWFEVADIVVTQSSDATHHCSTSSTSGPSGKRCSTGGDDGPQRLFFRGRQRHECRWSGSWHRNACEVCEMNRWCHDDTGINERIEL
jgi:hypothetical protein